MTKHSMELSGNDRELRGRLFNTERNLVVSEQIKVLRRMRGISQEALAHRLGTNQPTISRLERTAAELGIDTLVKISEVLEARLVITFEPYEFAAAHYNAEAKARASVRNHRVFPDDRADISFDNEKAA